MSHENTRLKNSFALSEVQKYLQNQKRLYLRLRFDITQMVAGALVNPLPQKRLYLRLRFDITQMVAGAGFEPATFGL